MAERTVILHYHLFKNAGTSLDRILQRNFPNRWVTREFPPAGGDNSRLVARWIAEIPEAVAFSSHTALGPVPRVDETRIVSILFLRDPIERILSAYRFERKQRADTLGARLAKEEDIQGYVQTRLSIPGDRQCRNFQTHRLASMVKSGEKELNRAILALNEITVIGIVEQFDDALLRLKRAIASEWPDFNCHAVHANRSEAVISEDAHNDLFEILRHENKDDLALLSAAKNYIETQEKL